MSAIKIGRMIMGICQTNCYFVYREGSRDAIVVDPPEKGAQIYHTLLQNQLAVKGILLTHGHFDHILGANELREFSGAGIYASEAEKVLCEDARNNMSAEVGLSYTVKPDIYLKDNQELSLAGIDIKALATPGHTIGGCSYYIEEAGMLISGDTLFEESVGRSDLPTGSMSTLIHSIKARLFVLPDATKVYPGHGESTTIGHEKKYNPFCQ